jgi:hypothetical protein
VEEEQEEEDDDEDRVAEREETPIIVQPQPQLPPGLPPVPPYTPFKHPTALHECQIHLPADFDSTILVSLHLDPGPIHENSSSLRLRMQYSMSWLLIRMPVQLKPWESTPQDGIRVGSQQVEWN